MIRPDLEPIARLMLAGQSPDEIARATGIDERVVRAWCSSPVFKVLAEKSRSGRWHGEVSMPRSRRV